MSLVDLHTHTNASDGSYTPSELVEYAIEKNLTAIAVTDHDTVDGIKEAIHAAQNTNLEVVPGIELSCHYKGKEIHILGYFVNYENERFLSRLEELKEARLNRNLKMLSLLKKDGFPISMELLQAGNPNTVITRAHFGRALVEAGYVKNKDQAFQKFIGEKCKYYLPKPELSPEDGLSLLVEAKGIPVLAHPMIYNMGYSQIEELVVYLKTLGLRGMEVYHSSNNISSSGKLREIARKYDLLPTGGSDFHGKNKVTIDLGTGRGGLRISHLLLEDLRAVHCSL